MLVRVRVCVCWGVWEHVCASLYSVSLQCFVFAPFVYIVQWWTQVVSGTVAKKKRGISAQRSQDVLK